MTARNASPPLAGRKIGQVPFLSDLSKTYALAPSAILIRAAEADLLRALPMEPPILDLACGDGYFASLIRPRGMEAGCDISKPALARARARRQYQILATCDVAGGLPFRDASFQTVLSNSSLEHVLDVAAALREVARVLKTGGRLYFTLASDHAYRWWPYGKRALGEYFRFHPVHHACGVEEWRRRVERAGMVMEDHRYYLDRRATRLALWLDYPFARVYLTGSPAVLRKGLRLAGFLPTAALAALWRRLFAPMRVSSDGGGGLLITARKPSGER